MGTQLKRFLNLYASEDARWKTGEPLENGVVVFHMNPVLYELSVGEIEKRGINCFTYPDFNRRLKGLVDVLKSDYSKEFEDIIPRVHNLSYIPKLHEEVSLNPTLIARASNIERWKLSREFLKSAIERVKELENGS